MDIRLLLTYAENARRLLRETLAAHPEALSEWFETIAAYHTIGELVAHIIGAEQRWTEQRLYAQPRPTRYEEQATKDLAGLFEDWEAIRTRTLSFAENADADALARVITTELPQWNSSVQLTAEEVLFHMVNHQMWHLGQISMALQQQGIDPPNFDYPFLRPGSPRGHPHPAD